MIDIDNWMRELEEEEDIEIKNNEEYQTKLFEEYVLRGSDHQEERRKLNERYLSGEELMGEHGLRKELAAFDMSYFGRAYLPHYFIRKSPHFHEELDEIWSRGVMKGRNPLKEAKVISRLKGSRQVVAAPRGHAKSTNFTFKDSLHVDIMLDEDGQPVSDGNGDTALVSDDECWLQDIKNEAMTEEGELFYEDEEGDASYGWSLLDFMQGEYDDFTQMEIQQRIRSKMSKRDYIDAGSIQTTVNFDGHIYHIRIAFRRTDSNSEYNIDIESNGVEVIVE